jgi:hypothetical protein
VFLRRFSRGQVKLQLSSLLHHQVEDELHSDGVSEWTSRAPTMGPRILSANGSKPSQSLSTVDVEMHLTGHLTSSDIIYRDARWTLSSLWER